MTFPDRIKREPFRYILFPIIIAIASYVVFSRQYNTNSNKSSQNEIYPAEAHKTSTDEALADYTLWLMVFTGVLAVSTVGLWWTTRRGIRDQARDMQRSIKASENTFIASHRAWVKASLVLPKEVLVINLRDDDDGDQENVGVILDIRLQNIGSSVALNINYRCWLFFDEDDTKVTVKHVDKCNRYRMTNDGDGIFVLFPGENVPEHKNQTFSVGAYIDRSQYERIVERRGSEKFSNIYACGCVNYTFPSDLAHVHQTRFAYSLWAAPIEEMDLAQRTVKPLSFMKHLSALDWFAD